MAANYSQMHNKRTPTNDQPLYLGHRHRQHYHQLQQHLIPLMGLSGSCHIRFRFNERIFKAEFSFEWIGGHKVDWGYAWNELGLGMDWGTWNELEIWDGLGMWNGLGIWKGLGNVEWIGNMEWIGEHGMDWDHGIEWIGGNDMDWRTWNGLGTRIGLGDLKWIGLGIGDMK